MKNQVTLALGLESRSIEIHAPLRAAQTEPLSLFFYAKLGIKIIHISVQSQCSLCFRIDIINIIKIFSFVISFCSFVLYFFKCIPIEPAI